MAESETELRKRELIRSINWWVWVSHGFAGLIGAVSLISLRLHGLLPPDEYSFTLIALHSIAIGLLMPLCLTTAFHVSAMPKMKVWFERLGALMLFAILPIIILLGIIQWIARY